MTRKRELFPLECDVCGEDLSFPPPGDPFGNASRRLASHLFRAHGVVSARRFSYERDEMLPWYDPHLPFPEATRRAEAS